MFDQSFSTENYLTIFQEENRKGHIFFEDMPEPYKNIVRNIKIQKDRRHKLLKIKKIDRTSDILNEIEELNHNIKELTIKKDSELTKELSTFAEDAKAKDFTFALESFIRDGKQTFKIDDYNWSTFFAIKNLQRTLRCLFKVKPENRHQVMSNVKLLLDTKRPFYLIRTDISSFFESIPQEPLLKMINSNNLVNNKTKGMIKAILREFNNKKDSSIIEIDRGIPRGIGISSYLSEIYMREIDENITEREEVIFYVRYVDDILIILSGLPNDCTLDKYYDNIINLFKEYGLNLHTLSERGHKCDLINMYNDGRNKDFTYLGYKISILRAKKDICLKINMSKDKYDRLRKRIDKAFKHFENLTKKNLKQAKRDLIDSLNLISGNYRLTKAKSNIKAGLFYGSDLLDDYSDLQSLTEYLHSKDIKPYDKVFKSTEDKGKYIENIKKKINNIDFKKRWEEHTMFTFKDLRLRQISGWLS